MVDLATNPDASELQIEILNQAYKAKLQQKFDAFHTVYEIKAYGTIQQVPTSFAFFVDWQIEDRFFIHISNVPMTRINPKI